MRNNKRFNNLVVRKRFGQNFLINKEILEQIIEKSDLAPDQFILEIGAGHGALTEKLLEKVDHVTSVEIDRDLVGSLTEKFKGNEKLDIVSGDILDLDFNSLNLEKYSLEKRKVIGNIPYYITTPIIMKVIGEINLKKHGISHTNQQFSELIIMLQKEVGERVVAKPGTKAYGALSVICQYACHVKSLLIVDRSSFYPAPSVDSMVISLKLKTEDEHQINSPPTFWKIVHGVFTSRRKTLKNSLKISGFSDDLINIIEKDFNLGIRGETMSLADFAKLSNALSVDVVDKV